MNLKKLELRLRANAPDFLRSMYRLTRSRNAGPSKPVPAELIEDCRFCASRVHMLEFLPRNGIVAELGTFHGNFARRILEISSPTELHLVDVDFTEFNPQGLQNASVRRHEGLTTQVMESFRDEMFDWIYVDADHSFDGVMADACTAASKLKPEGYLVFNDFAHIDPKLGRYGVHRAVVDFMLENQWPLKFFAYQASGLYDVAIQKPVS